MSKEVGIHLPFIAPDEIVGESKFRTVQGYIETKLVVKTRKAYRPRVFDSVASATSALDKERRERETLITLGREMGVSDAFITSSEFVVHANPSGHITYSEFQEWFKGGKTLSKVGSNIWNLPDQTLEELDRILQLNIRVWKEQDTSFDIVGSTNNTYSALMELARRLLPLFFSENILIDDHNNVRVIDHRINKPKSGFRSVKDKVRTGSEIVGSLLSSAIIQAIRIKRKVEQ